CALASGQALTAAAAVTSDAEGPTHGLAAVATVAGGSTVECRATVTAVAAGCSSTSPRSSRALPRADRAPRPASLTQVRSRAARCAAGLPGITGEDVL
ncbi:hypothetical protein, partial [Mycolicibacterium insubricum]|uniref:hypothetical protein n=1 Tax=Mycolicibacterium insubricum TaxID=444597 RepID=UPI0021F2E05B